MMTKEQTEDMTNDLVQMNRDAKEKIKDCGKLDLLLEMLVFIKTMRPDELGTFEMHEFCTKKHTEIMENQI